MSMTSGFAKPRASLPQLPYGKSSRVIINAHNFAPSVILSIDFKLTGSSAPTQSGFDPFPVVTTLSGSGEASLTIGAYTVSLASVRGARDRGALPVNTTPVGFSNLYRDFVFQNPDPFTIAVSGLTPSTDFDLRFFAFDLVSPNNDIDFVDITSGSYGNTGTVFNNGSAPTTDLERSVVVRVKSNTSGVINIRCQRNAGVGFPVCNGFIVFSV
jgi:hypothetical protein